MNNDETIKNNQSMVGSFKRIWPYLRNYKGRTFTALFLVFTQVITNVLEPFIFGLIITEISSNVLDMIKGVPSAGLNYSYIYTIIIIYFVRGLINQVSAFGSNYYMTEAVQNMTFDLRADITNKMNRLPISYFDRHQFGNILNRITNDVDTIANAFQVSLLQVFNAILQLIFVIAMMLWIQWQFALIMFVVIPLSGYIAKFIIGKSQIHFKQQADVLGRMNGFVQENLTGFNEIKLYGREHHSSEEFRTITAKLNAVGFKASFTSGLIRPLITFVAHSAYVVIALFGGLLTLAGRLTIGNLQAFTQYVWQINQPMQMLSQLSGLIQSAAAAINRVYELLDVEEETQAYSQTIDRPVTGEVSFDNVSFSYDPEKPLIQNFNVNVTPGETIAIVGPTGAGKTTMINLLMRFYDIDQGKIMIDGMDIRSLPRQQYHSQFGMVLQDTWLFEGTIKENLRFGNLNATDEEIIEAAKVTNVDHFIRTLPGGYDMQLNQESSNISQGQKQLLTIARALLSDPKILILDEATSSVDTRLEILIQKAMDRLMKGRTSFVIAHRLSTIQDADRILVMDNGQIIEQGNHHELLKQGGFYSQLYQSQFAE
ncbi:ABC transporter ATP-binding protein [Amphibacillus indicireducens]|uniref:ABC transporter ATP-binding protein n=1 Tax=Amphibacillus indicireducens TaxID=1076330 RepID=A0ABP7VC51_9BACI